MERNNTYYIKKGRKYIPKESYDISGFSEGLWLITNKPHSTGYTNTLYAVKTHDIQNIGKFSDFYVAYHDTISTELQKNYTIFMDKLRTENKSFSISDLTDVVIKTLSEIKD